MSDRTTELLLDALKRALAAPGEQRLYKSGKLEGLFPSRTGSAAEAAERACAKDCWTWFGPRFAAGVRSSGFA